jgi:hypothetical protein
MLSTLNRSFDSGHICSSNSHIADLFRLSYGPACALLKRRPFLATQALQTLLSELREHFKCLLIIFVRRPSIAMYKPLERVPEVRIVIPAFPIPEMCFYFIVSELYWTGDVGVDLVPVTAALMY